LVRTCVLYYFSTKRAIAAIVAEIADKTAVYGTPRKLRANENRNITRNNLDILCFLLDINY